MPRHETIAIVVIKGTVEKNGATSKKTPTAKIVLTIAELARTFFVADVRR
jgi:hypothetical protein